MSKCTYGAVEHTLPLMSSLFDVTLQRTRIQRFEQLEAAEELIRYGHDGAPIVKLAAVLKACQHVQIKKEKRTFGAEKTVTSSRSSKNS